MTQHLQPHLSNEWVSLMPLDTTDFPSLFAIASDPLIWEQHPNPDRYKLSVFEHYFNGAIQSGGALLVRSSVDDSIVGCTRFYDYFPDNGEIKIGYTFFSRKCWGKLFNRATKSLMLNYAFGFVEKVIFHVGAQNIRSRKAMEKLGAILIGEENIAYFGESPKMNVIYRIRKEDWQP